MKTRSQIDINYHEVIAKEYDFMVVEPRDYANTLLFKPFNEYIAKDKKLNNQSLTMLDIGCGTGHMLVRYANYYDNVTGIDHSYAMLKQAKLKCSENNLQNIQLITTDLYQYLRLNDKKFDLITMVGCLHHLSPNDFKNTLNLIKLHLKETGYFLIAEPIETDFIQPEKLQHWNSQSIVKDRHYSQNADDPDEAPINLEILNNHFKESGLTLVKESRGTEIFPHHFPPSENDKIKIKEFHKKYGNNGHVFSAIYQK